MHGQFNAQRFDVQLAAEAPHRDLERTRPARGVESDGLAVEHQRVRREAARGVDDFGNGGTHVVEAARVDAHVRTRLVHLDAGAIHFPFEGGLAAERLQRLGGVGCRLREHRRDGREQLELKAAERREPAA
jgi:hypothetical protein